MGPEHPYFPTPPGASWTYRRSFAEGEAPEQARAEVSEALDARLHFAEPGAEGPVSSRNLPRAPLLRTSPEALPELVLDVAKGSLWAYSASNGGPLGTTFRLPLDLEAGLSWTFKEVYMSCGWGVSECALEAKTERVSVPAGEFEALRIELGGFALGGTLWLAKGVGLVRFENFGGALELEASSLLPAV